MTTTIYIFYGTLLGMIGMLSVKIYEVKRRKRSVIYRIFVRFDEATHGMVARVFGGARARKQEFEKLLREDLKREIYQAVVRAIAHTRELYDKMRESSRGVIKLRENPKVSAFLKDIEEAKKEISEKNGGTGKIEEAFIEQK